MEINSMRTARKLATAGAAAFVLLGTLGVAAGPAGAEETGDPAPTEQAPVVDPQGPIDPPVQALTGRPVLVDDQDPLITGTVKYGQTLHVSTGTWNFSPTDFAYQWQHCDEEICTDIAGAITADHTPVVTDIGHRLGSTVTATNT